MYYYLDTNAIYDLKTYPVSLLHNSFTSAFSVMEIVTGIISEETFNRRKGALINLVNKKLDVKWEFSEQLLFQSFDVLNDSDFIKSRPGHLLALAS